MELPTRIYQKESTAGFFTLLRESLSDIGGSLFLARQLAVRDIKGQYRQSFLGIFWAFVNPLTTALVWIVLNGSGVVKISDTGLPYPVYVISGTILWSILTEAINSPMKSTGAAKGVMSKINFPKEALVVSGIIKLLFNSAIKVLVLIVFILFFGIPLHFKMLLFPLSILGALFFGTTLGLFITPLGMLYKDVSKSIGLGLKFLMYVTPVIYAIPNEGILKPIMEWNPITPILVTARDFLVGSDPSYLLYFCIVMLVCVPLFCFGVVLYRISIPVIIERLTA